MIYFPAFTCTYSAPQKLIHVMDSAGRHSRHDLTVLIKRALIILLAWSREVENI